METDHITLTPTSVQILDYIGQDMSSAMVKGGLKATVQFAKERKLNYETEAALRRTYDRFENVPSVPGSQRFDNPTRRQYGNPQRRDLGISDIEWLRRLPDEPLRTSRADVEVLSRMASEVNSESDRRLLAVKVRPLLEHYNRREIIHNAQIDVDAARRRLMWIDATAEAATDVIAGELRSETTLTENEQRTRARDVVAQRTEQARNEIQHALGVANAKITKANETVGV